MRTTKNNIVAACMAAIALIGFVGLCGSAMKEGKRNLRQAVANAFKQTVIDDLDNRLYPIKQSHYPLGRKVKMVEIATKDGYEVIEFEDSLDERIADQMMHQFVLADLNPLHPDTFNLLFRKVLAKNDVTPLKTGVVYQYKGKRQYSGNDSTVAEAAILLPPDTLDLKRQACVQAWATYAPKSIVKHISRTTW